jgi:hypothetical protein
MPKSRIFFMEKKENENTDYMEEVFQLCAYIWGKLIT